MYRLPSDLLHRLVDSHGHRILQNGKRGIEKESLQGLSVKSATESAQLIRAALSGANEDRARKAAAIIALNAGVCIYVSGLVATQADGVALAEDLISTGQALEKLNRFVEFTQLMSTGSQ